jgi:hypothetical protein
MLSIWNRFILYIEGLAVRVKLNTCGEGYVHIQPTHQSEYILELYFSTVHIYILHYNSLLFNYSFKVFPETIRQIWLRYIILSPYL